jgi:prepilin-type N-terminal cleavage/methylation domain-containing protein
MKKRGFTLSEMLVAMFLLSLLLVIAGEAVTWGLRAHRKGEASRVAASKARDVLNRICSEISTAVPLAPYAPNTTLGVSSDFQSAVLWPDPYQSITNSFGNGYYQRSQGNTTNSGGQPLGYDQANNRVIFTRPAKDTGDQSYKDYDYTQFVYVEYLTVPPAAGGTGQNLLYRRVYPVAVAPSTSPNPASLIDQANSLEIINPDFFSVESADPTDNPNTSLANSPLQLRQQQMVVEQLPHPTDQLQFSVQHLVYSDPRGQVPPRVPQFQSALLTVTVNTSVDQQGNNTYLGNYTMSEQVTIRADAQGL